MPDHPVAANDPDATDHSEPPGRWPDLNTWWNRECGGRQVVHLALPLMISTLSYSLMQFCDRVFLAWSSPTALAAVLPAGVMAWMLLSFPFGVGLYTNVFVAQYFGAKQYSRIGSVIWHGLILGSLSLPLFFLSVIQPSWIFEVCGHDPEIIEQEALYFRFVSIGSIAQVYAAVLTSFFIGQGRTRVVMFADVFVALINLVLDWFLIFGLQFGDHQLIPEMGIKGAAIATSIALWIKFLLFFALVIGPQANRNRFGLFQPFKYSGELLLRMVRFGSSNGLQFLIECFGIAVFMLMVAKLGETPAAATTVAISVNMMVFVPIWGLSTAVSTMVGQKIGDGTPHLAERATWTSLVIGLVYTGFFAAFYLIFPDLFLIGHEAAAENFDEISRLARWLLVFVAAYCVFDSIQIIFVGAIKGAGDTRFVVLTTLVCSGLFVGFGLLGHQWITTDNGLLFWWWGALTGWIILLSVIFGWRFFHGKWKTMQVIEEELIGAEDSETEQISV